MDGLLCVWYAFTVSDKEIEGEKATMYYTIKQYQTRPLSYLMSLSFYNASKDKCYNCNLSSLTIDYVLDF